MRLAALAALVLAAGCGGGVLTPVKAPTPVRAPRDLPQIPRSFSMELTTRRRVDGLTLRVYNTGSAVMRGAAVSSMKSWSSKVTLDVPVFLLKHPKQGYILFDTGPHPDAAKRAAAPFAARPGQDAVSQLAADKVAAADIKWVVISHLHLDHAGLIDGFPQATVLVDRREWLAQKEKLAKKKDVNDLDPAELEAKLKLRLVDFSSAASFGAFDHGLDLFEDGSVFLVDLAGHAPGNMGLWAGLDDGPVLLAGDASWILDNHQDLALPSKASIHGLDRYWRSLYQMRAMQEALPRLVIFPGHDLTPLKLQPRDDVRAVSFPR